MLKRLAFLVFVAVLAVPAAAAAKQTDVNGPAALRGHGLLRGELQASDPSSQVKLILRAGRVRVLDLAGDAKVTCNGKAARQRQNDQGQAVFACAGRRARVLIAGSHYRLAVAARQYALQIPEGVSGKLQGRFRLASTTQDPAPPADPNR
jgi:hypothetical protein